MRISGQRFNFSAHVQNVCIANQLSWWRWKDGRFGSGWRVNKWCSVSQSYFEWECDILKSWYGIKPHILTNIVYISTADHVREQPVCDAVSQLQECLEKNIALQVTSYETKFRCILVSVCNTVQYSCGFYIYEYNYRIYCMRSWDRLSWLWWKMKKNWYVLININ